jgi:hypothetical protein
VRRDDEWKERREREPVVPPHVRREPEHDEEHAGGEDEGQLEAGGRASEPARRWFVVGPHVPSRTQRRRDVAGADPPDG